MSTKHHYLVNVHCMASTDSKDSDIDDNSNTKQSDVVEDSIS